MFAARRWLEEVAGQADTPECVLWPYKTQLGYGRIFYDGRQHMATHVVLELTGRPRPIIGGHHGAVARHLCDQPACCNPRHLEWGTQGDNVADMARRRRAARGERSGNAKITEDDVREIRRLSREGWSQRQLGERFGISAPAVGYIQRRRTWAHVD